MATVLLIDDDAATVNLLRLTLSLEGHTVLVAETRDQALSLIAHSRPAVIVMDYIMPGLDAKTFLDRLRGSAGFKGRVLLCTGLDTEVNLPVDAVMIKPFDPEALAAIVQSLSIPGTDSQREPRTDN